MHDFLNNNNNKQYDYVNMLSNKYARKISCDKNKNKRTGKTKTISSSS
jgi:hypothetical protein